MFIIDKNKPQINWIFTEKSVDKRQRLCYNVKCEIMWGEYAYLVTLQMYAITAGSFNVSNDVCAVFLLFRLR